MELMNRADELLTAVREVRGEVAHLLDSLAEFTGPKPPALVDGLIDRAAALAERVGLLDDHMHTGGPPPVGWPHPMTRPLRLPARGELVAALRATYTTQAQTFDALADKILGHLAATFGAGEKKRPTEPRRGEN